MLDKADGIFFNIIISFPNSIYFKGFGSEGKFDRPPHTQFCKVCKLIKHVPGSMSGNDGRGWDCSFDIGGLFGICTLKV